MLYNIGIALLDQFLWKFSENNYWKYMKLHGYISSRLRLAYLLWSIPIYHLGIPNHKIYMSYLSLMGYLSYILKILLKNLFILEVGRINNIGCHDQKCNSQILMANFFAQWLDFNIIMRVLQRPWKGRYADKNNNRFNIQDDQLNQTICTTKRKTKI